MHMLNPVTENIMNAGSAVGWGIILLGWIIAAVETPYRVDTIHCTTRVQAVTVMAAEINGVEDIRQAVARIAAERAAIFRIGFLQDLCYIDTKYILFRINILGE